MNKLPYIHYSDPRVDYGRKEAVVYGRKSNDLNWTYSDRLFEYTYKTPKEPEQPAIEYWENILKLVQGKKVSIECVLIGANSATWFHYYIFGWKEVRDNESQKH